MSSKYSSDKAIKMILKSLIYKAKVEADQSGSTRAEEDSRKDKLYQILTTQMNQKPKNPKKEDYSDEQQTKEPMYLKTTDQEENEITRFMAQRELKKRSDEHLNRIKKEINFGQFENTIITGQTKNDDTLVNNENNDNLEVKHTPT